MRKMRLAVGSLVDRDDAGPPAAGGGGGGPAAGVGGDLPGRAGRAGRFELVACHGPEPDEQALADGQSAGGAAPARRRRSGCPHAMALGDGVRPGHRRHDRPGRRGRQRRWRPTASSPGCSSSARSGAACRTRTRRSPSSARSARSRRWPCTRPDIQQTLESLNQELRDKVDKIAEQQRRILILQDQLTGPRRDGGAGPPRRRPRRPAPTPAVFERDQGVGPGRPADDRAWPARWRPARRPS